MPAELPGKSQFTGLALTSLASALINCDSLAEASKWLKVSLKYHQQHYQKKIGHTLVLLSGLLLREKNVLHAEGMLKYALDLLSAVTPT